MTDAELEIIAVLERGRDAPLGDLPRSRDNSAANRAVL
jgi:hypothetical protein